MHVFVFVVFVAVFFASCPFRSAFERYSIRRDLNSISYHEGANLLLVDSHVKLGTCDLIIPGINYIFLTSRLPDSMADPISAITIVATVIKIVTASVGAAQTTSGYVSKYSIVGINIVAMKIK